MTIPDNRKSNGFGLVASYYTNPWYKYSIPGGDELNGAPVSSKLMFAWTGGLTVPIFPSAFAPGSYLNEKQDYKWALKDEIIDKTVYLFTDKDAYEYPHNLAVGSGNPFHSCLAGDYGSENFGIKPRGNEIGDLFPPSEQADPPNKSKGPFYIRLPGSGLDHVSTYFWGGGSKNSTSKIKNIIGLYWMEQHAKTSSYYAYVNKIVFLYQDQAGNEVPMITINTVNTDDSVKKHNDEMRKPDGNNGWCGPACASSSYFNTNKKGNSSQGNGVLRGAFLHPEQVKVVVNSKLELKGMWIEIYRNTGSGTGNPQLWMHSMFPWILDDTNLYGKWYLHPFDYMISDYGSHHNSSAMDNFVSTYYDETDLAKRNEYFAEYNKQIDYANDIYVDQSGRFSRKILVPAVTAFGDDGLNWTDDVTPLNVRKSINGYIST